jgi:hypothetical protein
MENKYDPKVLDLSKLKGHQLSTDGYLKVRTPSGHPYKGRKIFYHRLVVEKRLGRVLDRKEIVHHIDENKLNNEDSNLELFSNSREHHNKRHGAIKYPKLWDGEWLIEEYAGKFRTTKDIAEELGCNRVNVRYAILKRGIHLRRYTVTKEVMKHVREAAKSGGRKPKQR